MAAVAKNLRHHSIQDIDQQEDRLAVNRHSVGKGCPCVKRSTDMRELGLGGEGERAKWVVVNNTFATETFYSY